MVFLQHLLGGAIDSVLRTYPQNVIGFQNGKTMTAGQVVVLIVPGAQVAVVHASEAEGLGGNP